MSVDMTGTHAAFLLKGMTQSLAWDLEGGFDNVVLAVDESGDAQIERRVRDVKSSGHVQGEKFGLAWSREQAVPEEAAIDNLIDRYAANMTSSPLVIRVNGLGGVVTYRATRRRVQ